MIQENEIREQLLALSDLDAFEDWIVQHSWNMHQDSDPSAQKLVGKIELALAEYSNGHISEFELRRQLDNLARTYEVSFNPSGSQSQTITYSSNSLVQISPVGMQVSTVFSS
jgi:hypothetical protein